MTSYIIVEILISRCTIMLKLLKKGHSAFFLLYFNIIYTEITAHTAVALTINKRATDNPATNSNSPLQPVKIHAATKLRPQISHGIVTMAFFLVSYVLLRRFTHQNIILLIYYVNSFMFV